jgi:hypothetical protein
MSKTSKMNSQQTRKFSKYEQTLKFGLSISGALHLPLYLGFFTCGRDHLPQPGANLHFGLSAKFHKEQLQ